MFDRNKSAEDSEQQKEEKKPKVEKYTEEEWRYFIDVENEEKKHKAKIDAINKKNEKTLEEAKKRFPEGSEVTMLGVKGLVRSVWLHIKEGGEHVRFFSHYQSSFIGWNIHSEKPIYTEAWEKEAWVDIFFPSTGATENFGPEYFDKIKVKHGNG